jgi:predicted MFS family arabinose efflux permease
MINPDFRKLWLAQTISALGTWLGALGLLAILHLEATPAQMGVLETLRSLPVLLLGLFAGAWVDRAQRAPGRRPLLIWADLGRAVLLGAVVVAAQGQILRIEHLYVVGFLIGACTVLFDNAYHAYVPSLVARRELVTANSRLSASTSVAEVVAPGMGGLLVQWIGAPLTVMLDAVSFVVSALAVGSIRTPEPPIPADETQPQDIWREIQAGLRLVRQDRRLAALTTAATMSRFFGGFFQTLYALFALRVLELSPATMGALIGAGGIGSLLAALLVGRVARRLGLGLALISTLAIAGLLELLTPLAALPGAPVLFLMLIAQLCGDVFGTMHTILSTSLRQSITPAYALGRVNASYEFASGGVGVLGVLAGGLLGNAAGMTATLAIAACGIALSALWLIPIRRISHDLSETGHANQ